MIERFLEGLHEKMRDPCDCTYMAVVLPQDLGPLDRHYRFTIHLDAELRLAGLGCSAGGGTLWYDRADEEGPDVICSILDVDARDVSGARTLLRLHLPELGAPAGTLVQWGELEDRYDGTSWHLAEPRSFDEV